MFILGVHMGTRSTVGGLCMVNVAWEEQANGPEGAYCRVITHKRSWAVDGEEVISCIGEYEKR